MGLNPNSTYESQDWKRGEIIGLEGATVVSTATHSGSDGVGHEIAIRPDRHDGTVNADVAVTQRGDTHIPTEGTRVIVGYRIEAKPIVLGVRYAETDTVPDFEPGERRIGHPESDSEVRMQTDGTLQVIGDGGNEITLKPNGDIVLNGGSNNPVTSISTSTDSDGHVTSVSTTKSTNIFVP